MEKNLIDWNQDLAANSEEEYQALVRSLQWIDGFGLIFIDCPPAAGRQLIERVQQDVPEKKIETLALEQRIDNLYNLVADALKREPINILFITGLEKSFVDYIQAGSGGQGEYYKSDSVPRILGHLNLQRERFRDNLKICLVFILPFFGLKYFIRRAPDFFDWRSGVFKFSMDAELLQRESLRVCYERWDESDYLALTPQERQEKLLEIQTLILEEKQTPEQQAELFNEQGLLHRFSGEYQQAIASYDRAVAIKPDFHKAWNNRGFALDNLGRYEEAIASYDRAVAIKLDFHEAWNNRGIALDDLGRYEEAIACYDRALKIIPNDRETLDNRKIALAKLKPSY